MKNPLFKPIARSLGAAHSATSNSDHELRAWAQLVLDRRWSSAQKLTLIRRFSSAEAVYKQDLPTLKAVVADRWRSSSDKISTQALDQMLTWLANPHHHLVCFGLPGYPPLLQQLPDPPLALFCIGDHRILSDPGVALVGSRNPTPAGRALAEKIATQLAASGITIISGMALGIDAAAHQGALASTGSTVAVMGCGLDTIYPARHRDLFQQIGASGCVISEFPLGTPVSRYTFPKRNRLVSGLSLGTVIVEAAERSGTLITARLTMEQNRSLMVIPGSPMSRQYVGSHALIKEGASLITCAEDVLRELKLPLAACLAEVCSTPKLDTTHRALLERVPHDPTPVDSIVIASGLTAAEVSSMLLTLEVDGLISRTQDGKVAKLLDEVSP